MSLNSHKSSIIFTFIGLGFLYYNYDHKYVEYFKEAWPNIQFKWIVFAALAHLINHMIRSYRWSLLLKTQQQKAPWYKIFLAEMTGFFWNGLPGRGGEFFRCQSLARMHGIPIKKSLASVVVERSIEILFFTGFFIIALLIYFAELKEMVLAALDSAKQKVLDNKITIAATIILIIVLIIWLTRNAHKIMPSIQNFFQEFVSGIKITVKSQSPMIWITTAFTLLFYFLLEYASLYALKDTALATSTYGLAPAVCVFVALNLSHLIPSGHGAGAYQFLTPFALGKFTISKKRAVTYANITYVIQLFNSFVIGGICMLISFAIKRNTTQKLPQKNKK